MLRLHTTVLPDSGSHDNCQMTPQNQSDDDGGSAAGMGYIHSVGPFVESGCGGSRGNATQHDGLDDDTSEHCCVENTDHLQTSSNVHIDKKERKKDGKRTERRRKS